jgi:hypothetical protein
MTTTMTELPEWVKELGLKGRIQYDEPLDLSRPVATTLIRLRGSHPHTATGACALADVLDLADDYMPEGYRLSHVSGGVEHARGHRFTWLVTWIKNEVAERRYQDKQAARMSRFTHNEEGT